MNAPNVSTKFNARKIRATDCSVSEIFSQRRIKPRYSTTLDTFSRDFRAANCGQLCADLSYKFVFRAPFSRLPAHGYPRLPEALRLSFASQSQNKTSSAVTPSNNYQFQHARRCA